jgi:hypothetical protein
MLGDDAPDGGFAVLLCPAHSELPANSPTTPAPASNHLEHGADHHEESLHAQADSCSFSLAFVPVITPPESTNNRLVDIRSSYTLAPRQLARLGNTPSTLSARGPPRNS